MIVVSVNFLLCQVTLDPYDSWTQKYAQDNHIPFVSDNKFFWKTVQPFLFDKTDSKLI